MQVKESNLALTRADVLKVQNSGISGSTIWTNVLQKLFEIFDYIEESLVK